MEGGAALADVLIGTSEPGGRLPFTIPRDEADLPRFDKSATTVTYDRWHGQRLLDRDGKQAAYPLGFGLSYTPLALVDVQVTHDSGEHALTVRAVVENNGHRPGAQVVQVYVSRPELGDRFLVGFQRVEVQPEGRQVVEIVVPLERIARRRAPGRWEVVPGTYRIDVGTDAAEAASRTTEVALP
jgi:beta-glucosidase